MLEDLAIVKSQVFMQKSPPPLQSRILGGNGKLYPGYASIPKTIKKLGLSDDEEEQIELQKVPMRPSIKSSERSVEIKVADSDRVEDGGQRREDKELDIGQRDEDDSRDEKYEIKSEDRMSDLSSVMEEIPDEQVCYDNDKQPYALHKRVRIFETNPATPAKLKSRHKRDEEWPQ